MASVRRYTNQENPHSEQRPHVGPLKKETGVLSEKSVWSTPSVRLARSETRKALGDVSNKRAARPRFSESVNCSTKKRGGSTCRSPSPVKSPVERLTLKFSEQLFTFDQNDYENEEIETMHIEKQIKDDFEDIWPKSDRLSTNGLDRLLKWQTYLQPQEEFPLDEENLTRIEMETPMLYLDEVKGKFTADMSDKTPLLELDDDFFLNY